jgi:hypothetical protein
MENKIPTAEELLRTTEFSFKEPGHFEETIEFMKRFAKLHCEAQQEVILENASTTVKPYFDASDEEQLKGSEIYEDNGSFVPSFLAIVDKDSIINAYSLTNIN